MNKYVNFAHEIGNIMYVGGILSHIVIGAILGHPDVSTAYHVAIYKESSAYILIIPGLSLKIVADLILYRSLDHKPNWLKVKMLMTSFLAINAFVFLVPMMPELTQMALESLETGVVGQDFQDKAAIEQIVGMSNVIPLVTELIMGGFKPKLFSERK